MAGAPDLPDTPLTAPGAPAQPGLPVGPAIPLLNVTGLVITRADLVVALRFYVPQLTDLTPLDGDRFLLSLTPPPQAGRG